MDIKEKIVLQNRHSKISIGVAALVVLATLIVAVAFLWQYRALETSSVANGQLGAEVALLRAEKDAAASIQNTTPDNNGAVSLHDQLVPGQVDLDIENKRGIPDAIYFDALALPSLKLEDIWVEYGTSTV